MTPEYAMPQSDGILPQFCGLVPKWSHSVLAEPDFCSEWEAAHRATELALQCQQSTYSQQVSSAFSSRKRVGNASVSFDPRVDVLIGDDNSLAMFHTTVHLHVISDIAKPWSCRRVCTVVQEPFETFQYLRDLAVPVGQLFEGFIDADLQPPLSHQSHAPHGDPLFPSEAVSISRMHLNQHFPSESPLGWTQGLMHPSADGLSSVSITTYDFVKARCQVHDSSVEVSLGCPRYCPAGGNDASTSHDPVGPPVSQAGDSSLTPGGSASPIRLPPFAQQMIINLPMEFFSNPVRIVQGVLVRTWYLHHVNIPRSLQARQLMLTGPPHMWRPQILTAWEDLLMPAEDLTLDLVSPNPPRNWHETSIVFDLILAQGLYTGRFSGLVTISPTITDPTLRMYAIAVSLAPDISGQDVVTMADVQPLCNQFECLVFHARAQVYLDFNPVHRMHHGDSFVIYLSLKTPPELMPGSSQIDVADPAPEHGPLHTVATSSGGSSRPSGALAAARASPSEAVPTQVEEMKRINIYRLDRLPISVWVRWHQFSHLLQDVLQAAGLVPSELVALHPVLVKPPGEAAQEVSVIVQQQGDIAPGSTDTLVLLDTVFHQQGPVSPAFADIHIDRKVLKTPSPITRLGLLQLARVANYCEVTRNACLVSANHLAWALQFALPKTLLHGTYCRIQVLPPRTHGVDTCRAASLVEDVSDPFPPTFAQVYPGLPHHANVNARHSEGADGNSRRTCDSGLVLNAPVAYRQHHVGDDQQTSPPAFEAVLPMQAAPVTPNVPDWDQFLREFSPLFEELSDVEVPEEGPMVLVTTWFVHHDRTPSCLIGRLVRLSHRPDQWLELLCAPWIHMLVPFENIAFRIVRPAPTSDVPGLKMIHVILEQGLQQSWYVALFSVLFQGLHGDVTHRRAQSVPTHLSRSVIERILDIQDLCRARLCEAWSGRLFFHLHDLEQIFSGIGVSFSVCPFRNRFGGHPTLDGASQPAASSSQMPPRMSFRAEDATLFPFPSDTGDLEDAVRPEHAPSRLVPDLTVIWQHYLMTAETRPFRFYVESWFCDHDRFPRTNRGREVLLPPDPDSWRPALVEKWRDMIDPAAEVFIYVVSPPIGGPSEVLAHVLLAQHQHRGFVSALITTMAPGDDIWDPPRVALKLPSVVDKGLLIQESGLFMFCPPFMPNAACNAMYGDRPVVQDALRDAWSGDSCLCVAETLPQAGSEVLPGSDSLSDIHRLFDAVGRVLTSLVKAVVSASHSLPAWNQEIEGLQLDISATIFNIETCLDRLPQGRQSDPGWSLHVDFGESHSVSPCFLQKGAAGSQCDELVPCSQVGIQRTIMKLRSLFQHCHGSACLVC